MDMHEFAMFCKSMDTAYGYDRADKKVHGTDKMRLFALTRGNLFFSKILCGFMRFANA